MLPTMNPRPFFIFNQCAVLSLFLLAALTSAMGMTNGRQVGPFTPKIKQDEFVWRPDISPAGPVVILVSLDRQKLYVYRNGVEIGRCTISSGKPGHGTPTGVFTILEKNVVHHSSVYHGASMPFMERLTWGGVAIHAGGLPGYPESHGCVHVPLNFARLLYAVTSDGTTVIVAEHKSGPASTVAPGLLFAIKPNEAIPPGGTIWQPKRAPTGPVSIVVSSADGVAYIYRNGIEIGRASVGGLHGVKGSYVYSANAAVDPQGRRSWLSIASVGGTPPNIRALIGKVQIDQQFLANARALIIPGSSLVLTDKPVTITTHNGSRLDVLAAGDSDPSPIKRQ